MIYLIKTYFGFHVVYKQGVKGKFDYRTIILPIAFPTQYLVAFIGDNDGDGSRGVKFTSNSQAYLYGAVIRGNFLFIGY